MKYKITKNVFGFPGFIEIDADEYKTIKAARDNLFEVLFLEEKLDLVSENYNEFETELLSIASKNMIFSNIDYSSITNDRILITRRIMNLLSSGRMYIDQSNHHLTNIYGANHPNLELINSEKHILYDQKMGYRVIEALRNYVQHRGIPIHNFIQEMHRIENKPFSQLQFRVVPLLRISDLEEDKKFKMTVLDELKNIQTNDEIDMTLNSRIY